MRSCRKDAAILEKSRPAPAVCLPALPSPTTPPPSLIFARRSHSRASMRWTAMHLALQNGNTQRSQGTIWPGFLISLWHV